MRQSFITRLGFFAMMLATALPLVRPFSATAADQAAIREIEIVVDGRYQPDRIELRQGERVRLKFVRKEYAGCSREVVIPILKVRLELPPNKPVIIDLPALEPGEYEFRCGMNMLRGAIVVVSG